MFTKSSNRQVVKSSNKGATGMYSYPCLMCDRPTLQLPRPRNVTTKRLNDSTT
jgi:hypothetical protein